MNRMASVVMLAAWVAAPCTMSAFGADAPPSRKTPLSKPLTPAASPMATSRKLQNSVAKVEFDDGTIRYYRRNPLTLQWTLYLAGGCTGATLDDAAATQKIQTKYNVYYLFQGAKVSHVMTDTYKGSVCITYRIQRDDLWASYRITLLKETPFLLIEQTGRSRSDLTGTAFVTIENPAPFAVVNNHPDPEQDNLYTAEGHADATWNLSFQHYLTTFSDKAPGVCGIFPSMASPYPQNLVISAGNLGHFEFALPFIFAADPGPENRTRESVKAWALNQLKLIKPFRATPPIKLK